MQGLGSERYARFRSENQKGVLEYEKNNDKLYGLMTPLFLTRVFRAEAEKVPIPEMLPMSIENTVCSDNETMKKAARSTGKGFAMNKKKLPLLVLIGVAILTVGGIVIAKGIRNKSKQIDHHGIVVRGMLY